MNHTEELEQLLRRFSFAKDKDDKTGSGGGGNDDDDGDDDDDSSDDGDDGDDDKEPKSKSKKDDGELDKILAENNRLKREAAERDRKERETQRKRDEEEGKYKELYERERDRAEKADEALATERQARLVSRVAKRLKFHDPEDAVRYLDKEDMTDERTIERRLESVSTEKKWLVNASGRTGGSHDDDDDDTGRERERQSSRDNGDEQQDRELAGFQRLRSVKRKDT